MLAWACSAAWLRAGHGGSPRRLHITHTGANTSAGSGSVSYAPQRARLAGVAEAEDSASEADADGTDSAAKLTSDAGMHGVERPRDGVDVGLGQLPLLRVGDRLRLGDVGSGRRLLVRDGADSRRREHGGDDRNSPSFQLFGVPWLSIWCHLPWPSYVLDQPSQTI